MQDGCLAHSKSLTKMSSCCCYDRYFFCCYPDVTSENEDLQNEMDSIIPLVKICVYI